MQSLLLALALVSTQAAIACSAEPPQDVLLSYGLRPHGGRWIVPEESRLTRLLNRVQAKSREFRTTAQSWRDQIQRTDVLERQLRKLETEYEENGRVLQQQVGNLVVRQQLQEHRGRLSQRLGRLRLALKRHQNEVDSELYDAARRHANQRAELLAISVVLREAYDRLDERYQSLKQVKDLQRALDVLQKSSGTPQQLGTANHYREQVQAALKEATRLLETNELPLVVNCDLVQVDVLVAGAPATFLLDDSQAQTLVPLAQAERLRVVPPDEAIWRDLPYADRQVRVASATFREIRIGGVTLQNVPAYVTAAEHADLGARLGSDLLDRVDWKADRGRARLVVRQKDSRQRSKRE